MKKAIILHGWSREKEYFDPTRPSDSNNHWLPWIQHELLLKGVLAQTPEMPDAYIPDYEKWKKTFEQFDINEETILIGHSCGGGFLVRWLSENNIKVGKVVLVAPWLDPEKEIDENFFQFKIDSELASKTDGLVVMYSIDDGSSILKTIDTLKSETSNIEFQEFEDKGHFVLSSMKTVEFPELLSVLT